MVIIITIYINYLRGTFIPYYYNLHPTQALRGLVRVKTECMAGR